MEKGIKIYDVKKNFLNPWGTPMRPVTELAIGEPIEPGMTVQFTPEDFADEKIKAVIDAAVADGSIVEQVPVVMVKYVVSVGPIEKDGEKFITGHAIEFPEGDEVAKGLLETQAIVLKKDYKKGLNSAGPAAPAVAGSKEPQLRYRGSVVIKDGMRAVGAQTFHHILTAEGHEYDLTATEYKTEVKMSMPSEK